MAKQQKNKSSNPVIQDIQLQRIRQDVLSYREALRESEQAYFPFRVKMQRLFADTVLNGHVEACIQKRRDLTLLRDFAFYNSDNVENEEITKLFKRQWFFNLQSYAIDALLFGYSLISLGDIIESEFKRISIVRRWNVSPDRLNVAAFIYNVFGQDFNEGEIANWHIYVETPNEIGVGYCGNGLLYKVAIYEIFCRNLLGYNGDFVELFSQPYRVGKTNKTEETDRAELENALKNMGSAGYAIIDPNDEIQFLETAIGGTGFLGYDNLEKRCEAKISKIILGHADAIDSTPGKLGSDGKDSLVVESLQSIQTRDGRFIENIINSELLPKMRRLGFLIPEGFIAFKNDKEKHKKRVSEDESNLKTATVAKTMKDAGLEMDSDYFQERTGIICSKIAPVVPPNIKKIPEHIQSKLDELYA